MSESEVSVGNATLPQVPKPKSCLSPSRGMLRTHQPWLSGELTLAPEAMRKSTMG